ncbi:MAG: hypothetical protein ACI9P5_002926, partial [Saprospiraceae bacterium]
MLGKDLNSLVRFFFKECTLQERNERRQRRAAKKVQISLHCFYEKIFKKRVIIQK